MIFSYLCWASERKPEANSVDEEDPVRHACAMPWPRTSLQILQVNQEHQRDDVIDTPRDQRYPDADSSRMEEMSDEGELYYHLVEKISLR